MDCALGTNILSPPRSLPLFRSLLHMKVYVDTDAEVRLMRRIKRDIDERQRDVNGGWARERQR